MNTYFIIAAVAAVIVAVVITWLIMHSHEVKACNELENKLIGTQKDLENAQKLQKMQQESFAQQLEAVKSQLSAETEKLLKQREESLRQKAEETFRTLTDPLGKDLKAMQESFDAQKRSQTEGTASLKTAMEQAVKHLQDQTQAIGSKADNLAQALKGQNKMAGTWGEIILYNMLVNEGMVEGRDFDKEETLRDAQGSIVYNEDSGKRMRPDYILHDLITILYPNLMHNSDLSPASANCSPANADLSPANSDLSPANADLSPANAVCSPSNADLIFSEHLQ